MLSKDEQDRLAEIERALSEDDPRFAASLDFDHRRRHHRLVGGAAFILGIVVLVLGAVATQALLAVGVIISVAGFVVMVAAAAYLLDRHVRGG